MNFIILFILVNEIYSIYFPFSNNIIMHNSSLTIPLINETNDKQNIIINNLNIYDNKNINISALISDDFIFSDTSLYCKILNIPKDFIFLDKIDKAEITKGQYLRAQNNEIIFKQYRKNINATFTIQEIRFEYFNDYTCNIFPNNSEIPEESISIYKGNQTQLNISINACNNGFYEIENEYGICSNTRPDGYYLDFKDNKFKKCHNKCSDCIKVSYNDSNMMCLKCIRGYFYDSNTYNCISNKNETKKAKIEMEVEKNINFWLFITIFFFSLIIGILYFIVKPCKNDKTNEQKDNNNSEETEIKNELIPLEKTSINID